MLQSVSSPSHKIQRHKAARATSFRIIAPPITYAKMLDSRPLCIPIGRPRGVKAKGIRYENIVGRALLERFPKHGISLGQWFEYCDVNGRGYCQVDVLIYRVADDSYVACEIKLTDTPSAQQQLQLLYLPVIQAATNRRVSAMIIARNVTPQSRDIHDDFRNAVRASIDGIVPVWHFLGRGKVA